ncbi:ninein-like protein isoform X2 [Antennarius striatus]
MAAGDHVTLDQLDVAESGVSSAGFQLVLHGSAPICCSTPMPRGLHRSQAAPDEHSARRTAPAVLTATVGQRILSRLDDGSGCSSPEGVVALWAEEGIKNSRDILQTLDFSLDERLSLADLTLALDNELLVSGNGIHQAALISYKNEIQHLQVLAEQACRERDKVKADLELADHRNLQLVREVDDRHASMETSNQSRIRDLEQDFRDRLVAQRGQLEQESDAQLQQTERERRTLEAELQLIRAREGELQDELCSVTQENSRLEEELAAVKMKLSEEEASVSKLQSDLDQLLHDRFGSLDPAAAGLSHEERFSEIIKEYEQQCRELRDRNDELSSELELLKSHRSSRKSRRSTGDPAPSWSVGAESDSDESDMKRNLSPLVRKKLQPPDKTALCSLDSVSGPAVSIQTELALEQLEQKHNQELQQLRIQLDTQVNYYERSLERMRQSMEVERKDISQAFKLEISELEEQKAQVERQVKQLKETLENLQVSPGGGGRSHEEERRMQRERAELEQNFAREIGNLVQRLSAEKDQLEAELKLKMDQEVMLVREEAQAQLSHMKQQHAEGQRRLLHQLHQERQRLQDQRGFWEKRLAQSEQERAEEERSRISRMEDQHQEEVKKVLQTSQQQISQSEASLAALTEHSARLEDDLDASRGRCSELEARLEEACCQLEESIYFLEAHQRSNAAEEELQEARTREEELLGQVTQLKVELGDLQVAADGVLQDREVVADNCSRLSNAFIQQQGRLLAEEQTVATLRSQLGGLQDATATAEERLSTATAELDTLRADRDRLIQDLKDQAMAVDTLQLELDAVSEELDRRRSAADALQGALEEELDRTSRLRTRLDEEEEEGRRLGQENRSYARLADQLSNQIVEMEGEAAALREHLRDVSLQLNSTADLVPELRRQLNAETGDAQRLTAQLEAKERELEAANRTPLRLTSAAEENFEQEKRRMAQQLMELEALVLHLEGVTDLDGPPRMQLEEVQSENGALQERLGVLQQEVQNLEDDVAKKRRKLEEMEREHGRSRQEEERLHGENAHYREEVLGLSGRNLQLSNDNAELSARLRGDQESVRMLTERLASVTKEQQEEGSEVQRMRVAALQQEVEWTREKQQLERDVTSYKEKLSRLMALEAELSGATLKLQRLEDDKNRLMREADGRNDEVETLRRALTSLEAESNQLRSDLHAADQNQQGHTQEVTDLQRKLQQAQNKVEDLETSVEKLMRDNQELHRALEEQQERTSRTLQEETHKLQVQNQELQQELAGLQVQSVEVQKLTQEQQNLKTKLNELETARIRAQEQALQADTALSLVQAQHVRELQQLQTDDGYRGQSGLLKARLQQEQRRSQQLEESLRLQTQQSSAQIGMKQDQYEKVMSALQQRTEELETKLKGIRLVLQEKVQQLKDQLAANAKCSARLKDLHAENSQLMAALQVTEQRQKKAEKKNVQLEDKVHALSKLLREIVHVSLAT